MKQSVSFQFMILRVATPKKQAKASKKVSSEDCAKFIGSFVDNDRVVIKKAMKILRSFQYVQCD